MAKNFDQAYREMYLNTMYPEPTAPVKLGRAGVTPAQSEAAGGLEVPLKGLADTGASVVKGAVQGFVGLPGDIESLSYGVKEILKRGANEGVLDAFLRGLSEKTIAPTTEDVKKWLDTNVGKVGDGNMPTETIGELVAPGGYIKVAKKVAQGAKAVGTALAPKAGEMVENYLTKTGMILKISPDSPGIDVPSAPKLDTPAFKNWFGNSKVVDDKGQPMVVYHTGAFDADTIKSAAQISTEQDKSLFKNNGIYFSKSATYSSMYGEGKRGATMYPVYLSIKNPLVIKNKADITSLGGILNDTADSMFITPEKLKELKSKGYDGIVNDLHNEVVVFEPNQIKSVFNKGTFDPKDPRILYGGGTAGAATMQDKEKK